MANGRSLVDPPMVAGSASLTIYIPTWGRPDQALEQVKRLHSQQLGLGRPFDLTIVVSVNGDTRYDSDRLLEAGADSVAVVPVNVGGEVNYCLGWLTATTSDYLWILSDDDPIVEGGLARLQDLLEAQPDLVICARSTEPWTVLEPKGVDELEAFGAVLALYSASVFRQEKFQEYLPQAFAAVFSHFPQVELIRCAVDGASCRTVSGVPMDWLIDYSLADEFTRRVRRSEIGSTHGQIFFGSALLSAFGATPSASRKALRHWWRSNWHRASMYRRSRSRNGLLVDSMSRGQVTLLPLYLLSLPPWWRVKDLLERLG